MAPQIEVDPSTFKGTTIVTENKSIAHESMTNTTADQNAFIGKNKAVIDIENSVFDKTGDTTSDDNSNFRGQNAVVLGIEGSQINIKGSNITSNSKGSNAVFATGEGSVINVENTNIHTKSDSSRGLDATYKGTVNGKNLTITTEGAHSATLATDRGEGTITAEAAKLTTSGEGSPVIYSTGNIMVNNVNGIANNSEIGVVEGKNSITLTNSNVTGYKDNGFMLYQSFSGDAESGIARLKAENNTLTTHATGAFLYVNNTTAEVDLSNNVISMPNTSTLVKAAADSRWGKTGENGGQLAFTAEVTVRPVIELPDLSTAKLTVDAVEVADEDVDTELDNLRARFGSLKSVGRKAKTGDFVTIDLKAVIDGEEVDSISGVSYEIGKGNMLKGLDTALRGLKTDESATFTTELAGGEHAGEQAEVTVTATAVKQRELPKVDDEFAQLASEFDTVEELREDLVKQVTERKTGEQAVAARDALLEHLRSEVAFDVPEAVVEAEVAQHLRAEGKDGDEEHAKEIREDIVNGVRDQIILDVLAEDLKVGVAQDELLEFLFQTAQQYGMEPAQFLQGAQQAGQIPAFVSEVARNKSLAMALRQAAVVDSKGETVDLSAFIGSDEDDAAAAAQAAAVAAEGEDAE